jgi:hypothetical protein
MLKKITAPGPVFDSGDPFENDPILNCYHTELHLSSIKKDANLQTVKEIGKEYQRV